MVEREASRAVNLFGEGRSLAKTTNENIVKTISAISEKKTAVDTKPKKRTQKRRLLNLDCSKKGCLEYDLAESLATREENLRAPSLW